MIHLYQLPKFKDKEYSMSPFCLKLELYFKAMGIDYVNQFSLELSKSPTGKMPYIETQGKKYADSGLIIDMLESESGNSLDSPLSKEQKAQAWAFIRMCEDNIYWVGVYSRWIDSDNATNWKSILQETVGMPKIMLNLLFPAMKRGVIKQLKGQGLLLLSKKEIYQKAEKDIKAIADFLNGRKYFFNGKLSLVDIVVFSMLVMSLNGSCSKRLLNIVKENNLENFIENINTKYFT
ncbi:glutathione S-transferase family protein [Pseudofrancisella aestuarii]|uniref:Glutathione S-transferase family protein n=1 Tax=Pseudofrancisella aestuarii TaxID=2670347 RepID=A0ABV9TBU5_9GAMM|nr:glutathione S-transferase family protein [Pseudofrancisella aestuarii]